MVEFSTIHLHTDPQLLKKRLSLLPKKGPPDSSGNIFFPVN